MATTTYIAIIGREAGEAQFSILFPDFPEIASAAATLADIPSQATDALRTAIEARRDDSEALPPASGLNAVPDAAQADRLTYPYYLCVTAELPSEPDTLQL